MKKDILITMSLAFYLVSFSQNKTDKETAKIVAEGKRLYRSEMASWYGTDIFLEKFNNRRADIGGYFSYVENNTATCLFFSKSDHPKVIGAISFDSTYNVNTATAIGIERAFTPNEFELYTIRTSALKEINSDTSFHTYENTTLNLIPLITEGEKKVYVITGPEKNGVVIFGNDYLLTFDKNNKLKAKKQVHKNIIVTRYGSGQTQGSDIVSGVHTHLPSTGNFITPTDICTLMLYEKIAKWSSIL